MQKVVEILGNKAEDSLPEGNKFRRLLPPHTMGGSILRNLNPAEEVMY